MYLDEICPLHVIINQRLKPHLLLIQKMILIHVANHL